MLMQLRWEHNGCDWPILPISIAELSVAVYRRCLDPSLARGASSVHFQRFFNLSRRPQQPRSNPSFWAIFPETAQNAAQTAANLSLLHLHRPTAGRNSGKSTTGHPLQRSELHRPWCATDPRPRLAAGVRHRDRRTRLPPFGRFSREMGPKARSQRDRVRRVKRKPSPEGRSDAHASDAV